MSSDGVPLAAPAESSDALMAFADALLTRAPREATPDGTEISQYVTFYLREYEIALPILQCREILRTPAITRVPEAPQHVRGVVNLRGRIVPAIDARLCLGFEPAPPTSRSRLLVVEAQGRQLALLVDRISRIVKLARTDIQAPTDSVAVAASIGVARLGGSTLFVTDVARILHGGSPSPSSIGKEEPA